MKTKQSLLVIDDEETVRDSLASWLKEDGYEVDTAPDGPSGLAKLQSKRYAMLLVDLKMPGMDGLEVLTRAREIQPEVPLIIMTAYATVDTAVRAMRQGAYDYLVKPFEPEELSLMVGRLTSAQADRREPGLDMAAGTPSATPGPAGGETADESLREIERKHIVGILNQHGWNISRSARALGIDRVTLYNKIKKYQLRETQ